MTQGINFDLSQIFESLKSSQNITSINGLTLQNRGLYVAFGCYPAKRPNDFPIADPLYSSEFAGKKTAFINYTIVTPNADGTLSYTYLNENNSPDPNLRLADNVAKRCPPDCPN